MLATCANNCSFNNVSRHDGHWILDVFNSMSSTLPISKIAWLGSWLNIMFFFSKSSRIQILFEPILILSISFVFVSAISSFTTSACESVFVLRWASISILEVVCLQFPGSQFRFCGVVRNALCSSPMLPFCLLVQGAGYVCARSGMLVLLLPLLLAIPILFQRYLECRSWSFKPFEIYSISVSRRHTINTISRCRGVRHDRRWLRLPEFQSLILRFWWSYPVFCILVMFPTSDIRCFLWNCEIIMRLFFLWVISKRIRWC